MGENLGNWDLLLPRAEFAYNSSINRSTDKSPFEIVHGYKPRKPLDLIPLSIHTRISESAESFAQHVKNLHKEVSNKINLSNETYKHLANSHKRVKEFCEGDLVMIRLNPERFPPGTIKKLHARGAGPFKILKKIGPNAYVLELPPEMSISTTFNVSDLAEYKNTGEPFGSETFIESEPIPKYPPPTTSERREEIKKILDDKIITTRNKDYQRYLVQWQCRPESDNSWITREDLQRINPDLLEHYQSKTIPYSTESSFVYPGRIGVDTRSSKRGHSNKVNLSPLWIEDY